METTVGRVTGAKMERFFDALDTDGNGIFDESDWMTSGRRVTEEFGFSLDSTESEYLCASYYRFWAQFSGGGMTRSEFVTSMEQAMISSSDRLLGTIGQISGALLDLCDLDGDGEITLDEYTSMFAAAFNVDEEHSVEVFERLDRDGSGVLERSEVISAVRQFFASDDPLSPSHEMFGPLL